MYFSLLRISHVRARSCFVLLSNRSSTTSAMSSESSVSVKLDRKRVRRDPDVTLAHASDHRLDASIPVGVPLTGPSDRRSSNALSPEVELPEHRPETVPPQETGPSVSRSALKDSMEDGSSYVRPETDLRGSDPSDRVETDKGISGGDNGSLVNFRTTTQKSPGPGLGHRIMLSDCNDVASSMSSSMVYSLSPTDGWEGIVIRYPETYDRPWSPPSGYMCVYECFIKNGGLCFPIPRLLLKYCHRRRIAISQLTHGSIRAMMAVVVLDAERGGVVNLDEFEEISSFSPIGNTGRFYISPRGGYQLVSGHSSQVNRHRWSRYFFVKISRRTIGEFSKPVRVGWNFCPVEPVKRKTPKDSVITLLRKDKSHNRHWLDFLSFRIHRSYPQFSSGDVYTPLEDNSPEPPSGSNKKKDTSRKKKSSTPAKKKAEPARTQLRKAPMVKLNIDVVDFDEELKLSKAAPVAEREGL
ncbi:hypothetical protein AALP_AA6G240800 [Arabis alpina]|uniref:Uncharacterized protein n=1 Tax=Arabis alpina TaxID=50452 RepID=A0A087GRC8_ARAAL|nr:hypothetical protein AALP_AA6G240800 [Arabis alpina]